MRIIAFLIFIAGLVIGNWLMVVVGFVLYEFGGLTWMAAVTSRIPHGLGSHDSNNHGP